MDKRWVIDRMIGSGHDELEGSYLRDIALRSPSAAPAYAFLREAETALTGLRSA